MENIDFLPDHELSCLYGLKSQKSGNMKRRKFISSCMLSIIAATAASKGVNPFVDEIQRKRLKFGVIADLHHDIAYDAAERLKTFLKEAEKNKVDFIIELGDFCFPKEENIPFRKLWDDFPGEKYHVLGNHDMEICSKEVYMDFVGGMPDRYYSFDKGGFHFVVLDPNNLYTDGKYVPYNCGNFYVDRKEREHMDPEQLEWLKEDLASTNKRCIVFSHESFDLVVQNGEVVREIFEAENKRCGYNKIPIAISGHSHSNYTKEINGITYIQINSASYKWAGGKYACPQRFSEDINKKRPNLKYTLPYEDPLFAFITLDGKGLKMKGRTSRFIPPTPEEMGVRKDLYPCPVVPWIKDFKMRF